MKPKHTPLPWIQFSGAIITEKEIYRKLKVSANDAAFIVRAVNSYEALYDVKTFSKQLLKTLELRFARTGCSDTEEVAIKCLRDAIAKAEGRS